MVMAAAASKQGIILGCLWTAHLLPRPKEWKESITLKKKRPKRAKKRKKEKRKTVLRFFRENGLSSGYYRDPSPEMA
jgi:hypothetical protein